jgi:F-type H+-transporting ATPase subunit epsilon
MKMFKLRVLSPEGVVREAEANFVTLPSNDGVVTILADHEPYVTSLREGIVSISLNEEVEQILITSGYAKFEDNLLTLSCETAVVSAGEVDIEVKRALDLAKERHGQALSEEERALLETRLSKSLKGLHLGRKVKHHQSQIVGVR